MSPRWSARSGNKWMAKKPKQSTNDALWEAVRSLEKHTPKIACESSGRRMSATVFMEHDDVGGWVRCMDLVNALIALGYKP